MHVFCAASVTIRPSQTERSRSSLLITVSVLDDVGQKIEDFWLNRNHRTPAQQLSTLDVGCEGGSARCTYSNCVGFRFGVVIGRRWIVETRLDLQGSSQT